MNKLANGMFNTTLTENGAVTFNSTNSAVLDYYYHAAARRGNDNTDLFVRAYREDPTLAILAGFYIRDVRGGQGERNTFRQMLAWLQANDRTRFCKIVGFVAEYGRWDDLLSFHTDPFVVEVVRSQLNEDYHNACLGKPVSLLAKWMPSENAGKAAKVRALHWINALGTSARLYRRKLAIIRKAINLVESQMSAQRWDTIEYAKVPSRAGMVYRKAFSKRDGARYSAYLEAVKAGKTKINAGTLYPYEIIEKLFTGAENATLEVLWKALPDYMSGKSALVVCDTSGSMTAKYHKNQPTPIHVAISLAVYAAQRSKGPFQNTWLTFNSVCRPKKINPHESLFQIAQRLYRDGDWGGSTNLQSAFDYILTTAKRFKVSQSDMPELLFVVSDMEFNPAGMFTNFEVYRQKFISAGYTPPIIVFWNVNSRNNQTPVTMHESGVMLVSGCSPSIFKAALSTTVTDPYAMMREVINGERYTPIRRALEG